MDDPLDQFVVALKRERRADAPLDWAEQLQDIPDLEVTGALGGSRVLVKASPEAVRQLNERLGAFCSIEPVIRHRRSTERDL